MQPRIPPLAPEEHDEQLRELVARFAPATAIFTTLARHPELFRDWLRFGSRLLLSGELPARDRELLILRTAWRTGSDYEWGQHVRLARDAGLGDDEIRRITEGPDGWDAFDAALIRAADELHDDSRISDETWKAMAGRYDERQLIELPMLVGHYHLVAYALNSLGVQREDGVEGFPS